ncbi:hypothetical protein A8C56_18420 [Niabella ginsenosidivorans]|uniref:Uncharacterized protein n=1 Tax=Niabella ginsenosidivorans TaxID=1176587 RepID=A0A1A9I4T7_9BACT|nr:hypothetical protein [Niabella ginsenosidivorans]ANH82688.1 hypothetical protein A8C56_18420 [Niabella ginsenosidivorans]
MFDLISALHRKNEFISLPKDVGTRRYGVSVKYYRATAEQPYKRIDYEVTISLEEHELGWLMRLNKQQLFFNRHEPDTISERFAAVISRSLYPVETVIDGWGMQVTGIVNHEEIIRRWNINKQKMLEKYEGATVADFVNAVDKKMANSSLIQQSLKYDWFWNLFFHPKYLAYSSTYAQQLDLYLSVIPYRYPVRFPGIQKIIPEITSYGSVVVKFESEEMKVLNELLPEKAIPENAFMKLAVDFDLDSKQHFAMHTKAVLSIYLKEGKYTTVPVKKTQFTMYQL